MDKAEIKERVRKIKQIIEDNVVSELDDAGISDPRIIGGKVMGGPLCQAYGWAKIASEQLQELEDELEEPFKDEVAK